MGVVSYGPLGPCSLPLTLLIGDGVQVECPGGINESLGGLNHGSYGNCLSWTSKACSPSCINSFILDWCSAMLEHFYYRYLHVEVCHLGESSKYMRMHHPNAHGTHSA